MAGERPYRLAAILALAAAVLAIGLSPILVRLSEVGPIATAFYRVALPLPVFFLLILREGVAAGLPRGRWGLLLFSAPGLFFAGDLVFWHFAVGLTSVANATLLANLSAPFVVIGALLLLKERLTPGLGVGLFLALGGSSLVMGAGWSGGTLLGDLSALGAAAFYAAYLLTVVRLRTRFSVSQVLFATALGSAAVLLPLALVTESLFFPGTASGWAALFGIAYVSHLAGQSLIVFALAHLPASLSAVVLLGQPVVAAALGWLIFSEPLSAAQLFGGMAVLTGIALASRRPLAPKAG